MKRSARFPALFFFVGSLYAQQGTPLREAEIVSVPVGLTSKILSGKLLQHLSEKSAMVKNSFLNAEKATETVLLYFQDYPTGVQQDSMRSLGIRCYWETWTPPVGIHPYGFVVATMPVTRFLNTLSLGFLAKIETGENARSPKNNLAAHDIGADSLWAKGFTGTGVKVGILDSGLDTDPPNADLPASIEKADYSRYPSSIGTTVLNHVTGHGTHVTGTILGRGNLSSSNSINGGGSYKGMAPNASLVFLKIGNDSTGNSQTAGDIAAMNAAVDTYHANVLSMSYGGWDAYHDGSDAEDQAVDAVYAKGVPFFIAAGNEGASARHFSGSVADLDSTALIEVDVNGAGANTTTLQFNLVWRPQQGGSAASLDLRYYNSSLQPIAVTHLPTTKSTRGTSSQYSQMGGFLPSGNGTYYLRVVNLSQFASSFHIYEDWGDRRVRFALADPGYTIDQPATADHAIAVGAYVSRKTWSAYDGVTYQFNSISATSLGDIAPFSSRGPRIDGVTKPDIAAPGTALISLRDRDVITTPDFSWVSTSGNAGDDTAYVVMQGTSMATPVASGGATLLLNKAPSLSPQNLYDVIGQTADADGFTGSVPNNTWGHGKLDVNAAFLVTGLDQNPAQVPSSFSLSQNYPNPFNPNTIVRYTVGGARVLGLGASNVRLVVYDLLGRDVATLVDEKQAPGTYDVTFNGAKLASGVYFYRLTAGPFVAIRKMTLVR